tara:strand:- start:1626 stop:1922 length:297 start_codon:yes stop_codon:yes gene_type:complete
MAKIGEKEYDLNDPKEQTEYWTKRISKKLVGRKIVQVEYFSSREAEESMWDNRPVTFLLDNGMWLYPMRDDEGNDAGAIGVCGKNGSDTFPVLGVNNE